MLKRPHYITAGLVVVTTLIILNLPGQTAARLKLAIGSLFLPLFGLANSSQQLADKAGDALTPRSELLKENEALRRQNQQFQIQLRQAQETALENARLRQLVRWQEQSPWKKENLRLARVVLWDPSNLWHTIQIDRGSRDGLRANLPVLTPDGCLVGRIASVSLTTSQVVLISDPNCKVAAKVYETGDGGVIGGVGPLETSLVNLNCYGSRDPSLKPGQNVVTSGLGLVFPPGIPIGKVIDSRPVEYGLYVEARVKLAADLGRLEEVWVLFP